MKYNLHFFSTLSLVDKYTLLTMVCSASENKMTVSPLENPAHHYTTTTIYIYSESAR